MYIRLISLDIITGHYFTIITVMASPPSSLQPDSEVAQAGRSLEAFFTSNLKEVFPGRVFPMAEVDSDSDEYDEAYRTTESGFPWPERREQCHRKRKRRQSLKSRRNHF